MTTARWDPGPRRHERLPVVGGKQAGALRGQAVPISPDGDIPRFTPKIPGWLETPRPCPNLLPQESPPLKADAVSSASCPEPSLPGPARTVAQQGPESCQPLLKVPATLLCGLTSGQIQFGSQHRQQGLPVATTRTGLVHWRPGWPCPSECSEPS